MNPISGFTSPGDLVFDVGANRGEWTAMMRRRGCHVVSIEPDPDLVDDLRDRADTGDLQGVIVFEGAASDGFGRVLLHRSADPGLNSLLRTWVTDHDRVRGYPGRISSPPPVEVSTCPLSFLVEEYGMPTVIKVDTEGHDDRALAGLDGDYPRAFSFEYHGGLYPVDDGGSTVRALRLLSAHDFTYRAAQHETEWVTPWLSCAGMLDALSGLTWGDIYVRT